MSHLASNAAFRAYTQSTLDKGGYKPPTPAWLKALGEDAPLMTLDFARAVVAHWDRDEHPNDPCARAMAELLEYHEHSPYVNVIINFPFEGHGVRNVAVIARRSGFLYALRLGYAWRVGRDMFGLPVIIALDDDEVDFVEMVYPADQNDFFCMCDGACKALPRPPDKDEFTKWAETQADYADFCATPAARMTVERTLADLASPQ